MLSTFEERSVPVVEEEACLTAFDDFCAERRSGVRGLACALRRSGVPRGATFSLCEAFGRVCVLGGREGRSRSGSARGMVWNAHATVGNVIAMWKAFDIATLQKIEYSRFFPRNIGRCTGERSPTLTQT